MTTRKKDDTAPSDDTSRDGVASVSRDTTQGDTTRGDVPDGYERGYVAMAGGVVVAFGATYQDVLSESAAAGHGRPVIVPGFRPEPRSGQ